MIFFFLVGDGRMGYFEEVFYDVIYVGVVVLVVF